MRYYESIYERYLSKLPAETAGKSLKALMKDEERYNQYKKRFTWTQETLDDIAEQRRNGVPYAKIATQYNTSSPTIRSLCKQHGIKH